MGLLNISDRERIVLARMFNENLRLNGTPAIIHPVKDINSKYDSDSSYEYADYVISTDIIFDEQPSPQSLKALGWFSYNEEVKPAIAYFPTMMTNPKSGKLEYFRPMLGTWIEIVFSTLPGQSFKRDFYVTKIPQGSGTINLYWTVGLSPLLRPSEKKLAVDSDLKKGERGSYLNVPKNFDL